MTEKRFRLRFSDGDNGEVVNQKGVQLSPRQIVDLLNSLYDENEQLKLLLKEAEDEIENLKKSNRELLESLVEEQSED